MPAPFFSATTADTNTADISSSIAREALSSLSASAEMLVGENAQRSISDAEREAHIRDLGRLVEQAYANGDRDAAFSWQAEMYAAIALRSPAKRAEMEAQIQQRIDEGVAYFMAEGDKARRLLHKD